ncbi:MAG: two-component system response regulator [Myxococcaceae bacterium]
MLQPFWTVLVIEDDDATREATAEALSLAQFAVFTARSLNGACNLLRSFPGRCLVLLDLHLNGEDGREVLDFLGTLPDSARRFPVIVVSADSDVESLRRYPFVIDVVAKPVEATALLRRVIEHAQLTSSERSG